MAIVMHLAPLGGVGGAPGPRFASWRSPGTPYDGLTTPRIVIPVPYGGCRGTPSPTSGTVDAVPHACRGREGPYGGSRGP